MPRKEAGFILITALAFLLGVMTFATVGTTRALSERMVAQQFAAQQQVFHLAEAGGDEAVQWLQSRPSPPKCPGNNYPCQLSPNGSSAPRGLGSGTYTVTIDLPASNLDSLIKDYLVTVTATVPTAPTPIVYTLTHRVRTESFARFAWFENNDRSDTGGRNWFISMSRIRGPFHTNGQLNVVGTPVFEGPVTTAASSLNCWNGCPPDSPTFQQGATFGMPSIPMPSPSLEDVRDKATWRFSGATTVTLLGDTLQVTNGAVTTLLPLPPDGGALFVNGDLTVTGGQLNGQLTLASDRDVVIADHVRYTCNAEDPPLDPDCINPATGQVEYNDDLLGIVTKRNIVIARTAPTDLVIHSTLMAVQGVFKVENDAQDLPPKGNLHVFGGIIQNYIGVTGWWCPATGTLCKGYLEDYWYDERARDVSPPFFPTTGRYQGILWQGQ